MIENRDLKNRTVGRSGSPSARRRERVRGKWLYEADLSLASERWVHGGKQTVGTLIPWLMVALPIFLATSRAATELASWGLAVLTLFYIALDAFAAKPEFKFLRLGPDLALGAALLFGLISVFASFFHPLSTDFSSTLKTALDGLGQLRWIPLLYLFVFAWELFPGLNRVICALVGTVFAISIVTWIQHFQGVDWITGEALANAPTGTLPYFVPRGFFGSTEALATLFACVLPFPVAAACLRRDRQDPDALTWIGFGLSVVIALALIFTYRPGLWSAGIAGAISLLLFPGERRFKLLLAILGTVFSLWLLLFVAPSFSSSSSSGFDVLSKIEAEESSREERNRANMNGLVKIWEESPILGVSGGSVEPESQVEAMNVYFWILARTGIAGLICYLAFILHHLLNTLRLFHEVPESHHRHRVLVAGCFASQCAFHIAGLFWGTMTEAFSMNLFILVSSMTLYMNEHYAHGLVPDDNAL